MKNFTLNTEFNASPVTCYDALSSDLLEWWSSHIEGETSKEGGVFTVHFGVTRKTFKVIKLLDAQIVRWACTDSYLDLDTLTNKSEWTGTEIIWSLEKSDNGTRLTLEHIGLNPSVGCYEACEQGWCHFVNGSLKSFVETGKGLPFSVTGEKMQ